MSRPRRLVPLLSLAAALATGPFLAGVALAADPIVVRPGDTLTVISKRHGISIADLVDINDLADPNRIYAGQRLRVEEQPEPAASGAPPADRTHQVRSGEHLTGIARHYGVSISAIVAANEIADPSRIFVGQRLTIPGLTAVPTRPSPAAPAPSSAPPAERTHEVRSGEHLTGIARHYGVSISAIAAANEVADPSRIFVGQRLTIPGLTAAPTRPSPAAPAPSSAPPAERTHQVRSGEHLTGIARHYGVSISAIVAANEIADPSRIFVGQRLTIPGLTTPRAETARPPMPASMRELMEARDGVRRVIVEEAARFDVPAALALAVAWQESGWRQNVVSHAGAIGVMQVLPATGEWVGATMLGTPLDLRDTRHNVRAGVRLLAHYLERYGGNVDLVLAAYYQGQTAVDRHGVYPISRPYVASIKALVRLLGG